MHNHIAYYPASLSAKAIILVAHGLNMKPEGMLAITQWLNGQGADVYLVKLSGHFENSIPIKNITPTLWEEEMLNAYQLAKEASIKSSLPLFFVGYSLGALLGQAMMLASQEVIHFDKQVLIAPATAIRWRGYLIKYLFFLNKKLMLPSYTPSPYRANNFLPLTAFEVLFKNEKNIIKTKFNKLNIPTLILIDPKDELVSYRRLVKFSSMFNLTNYEIMVLDNNLKARKQKYHHLIVSEETMGKQNWEMATKRIAAFLFNGE